MAKVTFGSSVVRYTTFQLEPIIHDLNCSEMDLAYSRCAKTFKPKSGIVAMKTRFIGIKNSDKHRQELERLQIKIRDMKTKFLVRYCSCSSGSTIDRPDV
jgi:hypothetical protein